MSKPRWISYKYPNLPHFIGPGVYAAYLAGSLVYIGSSSGDVVFRLCTHDIEGGFPAPEWFTPWGQSKDLVIKVSASGRFGSWLMREARLIRKLRPAGNTRGTGRKNRPYRRKLVGADS